MSSLRGKRSGGDRHGGVDGRVHGVCGANLPMEEEREVVSFKQ